MVVVEVIVEVQMLSSNKYFNSNWRRELKVGIPETEWNGVLTQIALMAEATQVD